MIFFVAGSCLQSKLKSAARIISVHDSAYFVTVPWRPRIFCSYPTLIPKQKLKALIPNAYIESQKVSRVCAQKETDTK